MGTSNKVVQHDQALRSLAGYDAQDDACCVSSWKVARTQEACGCRAWWRTIPGGCWERGGLPGGWPGLWGGLARDVTEVASWWLLALGGTGHAWAGGGTKGVAATAACKCKGRLGA